MYTEKRDIMVIDFSGRTVFLTGGSRGIGKKIKEVMEQSGAKVIAPGHAELDLSSEESILAYLEKEKDLAPDIFIHCAGINKLAGIEEITIDDLEKVYMVNCFSAVLLMKKFSERMKENKWGRVVLVSSLYSMVSRERRLMYSSSKNALTGIMKTLTLELAPYHILVNCVAPGYVMTEMTKKNLSPQEIKEIENNIPTHEFQSEEDIANTISFLCSEMNGSITGQLIAVDGGFLCR